MGAQVIADGVWVGGEYLSKGTRRDAIDPELAARVGAHLWVEEAVRANIDAMTGEALTGLKDGVWIDGVFYARGTVPPNEVIGKVGAHMWVQGFPPIPDQAPLTLVVVAPEVPPPPEPEVAPVADLPLPGTVDEGAPEVPQVVDAARPEPEPDPVAVDVPNRGGKGSSKAHWLEYARSQNVEVTDDMERHDVIAACQQAGVPVD
jgi:hypothetical protein